MDYKTSVPFTGSGTVAIEAARLQLSANGFKLDQPGKTQLIATGPGMRSTDQDPILGVSHAKISVNAGSIELQAELGGVKFMQRFIFLFPPALGGFLALTFFFMPEMPNFVPLLAFAPILPWLVISPLMAKWIKTRTIKAVDTLVHNMANARRDG